MNVSATFNVLRLLQKPSSCLPQASISNFNHLPIPLSTVFVLQPGEKVDIRAVVLDKDNCFAKAKENVVHQPYKVGSLIIPIGIIHLYVYVCRISTRVDLLLLSSHRQTFESRLFLRIRHDVDLLICRLLGKISSSPRSISWISSLDRQQFSRNNRRSWRQRSYFIGSRHWCQGSQALYEEAWLRRSNSRPFSKCTRQ